MITKPAFGLQSLLLLYLTLGPEDLFFAVEKAAGLLQGVFN